ncbi:MAG: hypothetical protein K2J38_02810 [Muribaculaceae bacterium]|nr:hypothetical protein [Muribaculaceae bacterium]
MREDITGHLLSDIELKERIDLLRRAIRSRTVMPDQIYGRFCTGERVRVATPMRDVPYAYVPKTMIADAEYEPSADDAGAWERLRCRHDFEYWARRCVRIKDKETGRDTELRLNPAQRRVLEELERQRLSDSPIRVILLKARQWGGSTLVQMYMAWIQLCHRENWNSVILAHVKDAAANIRGMYTKLLDHYPTELWDGGPGARFKPFERTQNIRMITGRNCRVALGSSESPDSLRSGDYAMAHLSETSFWASSRRRSPGAVIRSICGSVSLLPYSMIVIESTANGTGDYFHTEWLRAKCGVSDLRPIFVPWFETASLQVEPKSAREVLESMSEEEERLWEQGCDTSQINWHRERRKSFSTEEGMNSEFPSDDVMAFASTSSGVFAPEKVEALRQGCREATDTGEVDSRGKHFTADKTGCCKVWEHPAKGHRYVVAVDVGGRSVRSDWSVIAVLDADGVRPSVVAQWRGHTDHDVLAYKSRDLARYYNNALLVIESNTYETGDYGGGSDSNLFILNRIAESYGNMYMRETFDSASGRSVRRYGFHTNRSTKVLLINGLIESVREGGYTERDNEACNELLNYVRRPNGTFGASEGHHDDIVMTRAIALHVIRGMKGHSDESDFDQQSSVW